MGALGGAGPRGRAEASSGFTLPGSRTYGAAARSASRASALNAAPSPGHQAHVVQGEGGVHSLQVVSATKESCTSWPR